MSTELTILQNELTIAKQNNEILELRHQLQIKQAEKSGKLEDSLFSPGLYEHYQKVAVMMSKSEIVPNAYRNKPADIFIAMEMGYQLGFPLAQSLQDIAVINGRPCLWGDGLLALVLSHPDCESVNEEPILGSNGETIAYKCAVKRKGYDLREQTFSLKDAQQAGLLKKPGPWTSYPKRMLQMRARAFALRDVFGDALRGFKVAEEMQDTDIIEARIFHQDKENTQTEKLKQILGINGDCEDATMDEAIMSRNADEPSSSGHNVIPPSSDDCSSDASVEPHTYSNESFASSEQLSSIEALLIEKEFTDERKEKAFRYYGVTNAKSLKFKDAQHFIKQLERSR